MRPLPFLLTALLLGAGPAAAQFFIAPLPLSVTFVPESSGAGEVFELLTAVGKSDVTLSIGSPEQKLASTAVRACLSATRREPCFRRELSAAKKATPTATPHVVLLVEEDRRILRGTCIGAGPRAKDEAKQAIVIELAKGLKGSDAERSAEHAKIVQCLLAARQETTP